MNVRSAFIKRMTAVLGWAAVMYLALQVGLIHLPASVEHIICGPWGCGPPLSSVIAWQMFMVFLVAGPTVVAARQLDPPWPRRIASLLFAVAGCLLVGLVIRELIQNGTLHGAHFIRRILYLVLISTDLPILSCLVSGFMARRIATALERASSRVRQDAIQREPSRSEVPSRT